MMRQCQDGVVDQRASEVNAQLIGSFLYTPSLNTCADNSSAITETEVKSHGNGE